MINQTATPRRVTLRINKRKKEAWLLLLFFTTVIDLDINFPKYPACDAGGFIDYIVVSVPDSESERSGFES